MSKNRRLQIAFSVLTVACLTSVGCSPSMEEPLITSGSGAVGTTASTETPAHIGGEGAAPAFYSVSHYDSARDPVSDLAAAVTRASAEGKLILLVVGGDWCPWCERISNYMATNEAVRGLLEKKFVVMKVTHPSAQTKSFLAEYPACEGYPHLFVLSQDGRFLHSQGTADLEQGDGYDEAKFAQFLSVWNAEGM